MFLYLYAIIQGIVQGITELLPISSTAHLKIVNRIITACGGSAPSEQFNNMFDVVIQLGSILAFLVYFHEKLVPADMFRKKDVFRNTTSLWFKSGIGLIPTAIAGFLFADYVEQLGLKTFIMTLLLGGVILLFLESRKKTDVPRIESIENFSCTRAFCVGLFQCLALIPGTSRSAATIIGGLFLGASRPLAVEFSFFLAIPTMVAASGYSLLKHGGNLSGEEWIAVGIGFIVSFFVSWATVILFMKYIRTKDFKPFGWYRIGLAIVLGILLFSGILTN